MKFLDTGHLFNDEILLDLERAMDADASRGYVPAYFFRICLPDGTHIGECDLRIGHNESTYYGGNTGYRVFAPYRGHHYAEKASRLLFTFAKEHGLDHLIITCNPDNFPSRRTCERLGGTLLEIAELPEDNEMALEGETHKCIFRYEL